MVLQTTLSSVTLSKKTARNAGLVYVSDQTRGIRRVRIGKGFRYLSGDKPIRQARDLKRIQSLVIPPAWRDVWICADSRGHLQATGHDDRGRKQYLYHPDWQLTRDQTKYDRTVEFGKALGKLRRRVDRDLRRRGFAKQKIVATVVRLLQTTLIRVGNEEYAQENHSFGLTTLRNRHVRVKGSAIHFEFNGKSGVKHAIDLHDQRIGRIIKGCQELPGQELFQYVDENDKRHPVLSDDVNAYLQEATGRDFTAKDFRTWAGTVLAAVALNEFQNFDSEAAAKRNIVRAVENVAKRLGNTKSVCRKSYIHPAVLEAYVDGKLRDALRGKVEKELRGNLSRLSSEEVAVLAFLQQQLKGAKKKDIVAR